jgi:murein DD-endopeptidase MepM/ murein hydrolase activator NlpD
VEQKLRKKKKLKPGKKQNQTSGRGYTPVRGAVIANFGAVGSWARYHTGMDFTAAYGAPVRAAMPGRVTFAGNAGDWAGNFVVIRHDDGQKTLYAHLSSIGTHPGVYVSGGTIIGRVGTTGRSFGPHLHLELYPQSARAGDVYRAIDPGPWLRANGVKI